MEGSNYEQVQKDKEKSQSLVVKAALEEAVMSTNVNALSLDRAASDKPREIPSPQLITLDLSRIASDALVVYRDDLSIKAARAFALISAIEDRYSRLTPVDDRDFVLLDLMQMLGEEVADYSGGSTFEQLAKWPKVDDKEVKK